MSSGTGFPGGGADFYAGSGLGNRSNASQPPFRSQLSGIFLDSSSQIGNQTSNLLGKRTMSEFQSHQQQNNVLNSHFLRSVKPRSYNHMSPVYPLTNMEYSGAVPQEMQQQRYGMSLPQFRHQPLTAFGGGALQANSSNLSTLSYLNAVQNQVIAQESEQKMRNRLLELEKELLDDNDEGEGDDVSVITNTNSEWSEAIHNLIVSSPKPISPSPTTSSSSSSSSVVSPPNTCSKKLLTEAASAISEAKTAVALEIITHLSQAANQRGNSEQRLTEYMLSSLKSRLNPAENQPPVTELFSKEHDVATHMLYGMSPCFKLGFMAANHAIIEATLGSGQAGNNGNIHVIDFEVGQGGQYANLLHVLSSRQNGKPVTLKITTVVDNDGEERLKSVGDFLNQLAEKVGVVLQFNVVKQNLVDITRDSLSCEPDEPLVVNFAFMLFRMPDESVSTENPRDRLLRRVKGLSPLIVTIVEHELNTNTAPFTARVTESCSYYGALFDSLEATVGRENPDRVKVEEGLGRKLANSVACEGRDRVERCEVFGKWRARMGMAGFELKRLSQNVAGSVHAKMNYGNQVNPGFIVKEENGAVCFGWMGRTLTVASAWH